MVLELNSEQFVHILNTVQDNEVLSELIRQGQKQEEVKMTKFKKDCVHFVWSDELVGKHVYCADGIDNLKREVEQGGELHGIVQKGIENFPFLISPNSPYRFAYYDPELFEENKDKLTTATEYEGLSVGDVVRYNKVEQLVDSMDNRPQAAAHIHLTRDGWIMDEFLQFVERVR